MTNRTKGVVSGCAAMFAAGFTHFQLTSMQLATSMFLKAAIVGLVAGVLALLLLTVLPASKGDTSGHSTP